MTTLTERLRELEVYETKTCGYHSPSLELAQELHALLVGCGEVMGEMHNQGMFKRHDTLVRFSELLTKLKQAGIV